jgi:hypothetical protein
LRHCACAGNLAAEKLPDFAVDIANVISIGDILHYEDYFAESFEQEARNLNWYV